MRVQRVVYREFAFDSRLLYTRNPSQRGCHCWCGVVCCVRRLFENSIAWWTKFRYFVDQPLCWFWCIVCLLLCDLFQLLVGSYGLWVDGGYASVVLTSPRYVMCVSQRASFLLGVRWADDGFVWSGGCMLCRSMTSNVLLVLVDVIYLSFFQFFCQ